MKLQIKKNMNLKFGLIKNELKYSIINNDGGMVRSHLGQPFFIENQKIARLLIKDFNELQAIDVYPIDLNDSLIYCVLSTFMSKKSDTASNEYQADLQRTRERISNINYNKKINLDSYCPEELFIIDLVDNCFFRPLSRTNVINWVGGIIDTNKLLKKEKFFSIETEIALNNLQKYLEIIREVEVKIVSYTVQVPSQKVDKKFILKTFENKNFLIAREKSLILAKKHKEKTQRYNGIQVIINYDEKCPNGKYKRKSYKILTGSQMGSDKILNSLAYEGSLLIKAKKEFPKMLVDEKYLCVNQLFNSLYYFAANW